jgi:hypothetical protein
MIWAGRNLTPPAKPEELLSKDPQTRHQSHQILFGSPILRIHSLPPRFAWGDGSCRYQDEVPTGQGEPGIC